MSFRTQSGILAAIEVYFSLLVRNCGTPQGFLTRTRYDRSQKLRGIILLSSKFYKQFGLTFMSLVLVGCAQAVDSIPLVRPTPATDTVALGATLIVSPEPQRTMEEITPTSLLEGSPPTTPVYGHIYHTADGNRFVSGRGGLLEAKPLDIHLAGEPEWVVAARVVRVLDMLALWRGYPKQLRLDNGPELISQTLADWAAEHDVDLAFIQPGKPAQNAFIERFNRTYREAVLDAFLFHTVAEVQAITEDWLEEYNAIRPHEALGNVPPYQYASKQQ